MERTIEGELDVPVEGATRVFDEPFEKFAAHHFSIPSEKPNSPIFVHETSNSLNHFSIEVLQRLPPEVIGKDAAGNDLLRERPPISVAAHVVWRVFGE